MSDAVEVMTRLGDLAAELNDLSNDLAKVERSLEPVEAEYEAFMDGYEVQLWEAHIQEDAKLPSEAMRARLGRRAMDPALLGRHTQLVSSRKRMEKRIAAIKTSVSAQQSILSALKLEAEASGAGLRRAA